MPKDLVDSFRPGDELTGELVDAIVRELKRLRGMYAAEPLVIEDANGPGPPLLWMLDEDVLVPFQNATGSDIGASSLTGATPFTATLLVLKTSGNSGSMTTTNALTTNLGRHIMNVTIKNGANGFGVWYGGYFYPVTWDNC